MQIGGRMSEFWCEEGWKLAPPTTHYAMCKLGKWDRAIPNCVRPGCDKFNAAFQVKLSYEMNEAIARFECTKPWPELELIGDSVLSCDGVYWNGTLPTCRKPPPTTTRPTTSKHRTSKASSFEKDHIDYRKRILFSVSCANFVFVYYTSLFFVAR